MILVERLPTYMMNPLSSVMTVSSLPKNDTSPYWLPKTSASFQNSSGWGMSQRFPQKDGFGLWIVSWLVIAAVVSIRWFYENFCQKLNSLLLYWVILNFMVFKVKGRGVVHQKCSMTSPLKNMPHWTHCTALVVFASGCARLDIFEMTAKERWDRCERSTPRTKNWH